MDKTLSEQISDIGNETAEKITEVKAKQETVNVDVSKAVITLSKQIGELKTELAAKGDNEELEKKLIAKMQECAEEEVKSRIKNMTPVNTEADVLARFETFKASPHAYKPDVWQHTESGKKYGSMRGFLNAIKNGQVEMTKTYDGLEVGDDAQGGYLVPEEFTSMVWRLLYEEIIIMRLANIIPMSMATRTLPTEASSVTVYWPGEATAITASSPTFGQHTQTAKTMGAIVKTTNELLRDSAVNLSAFLSEIVAEAMGQEIERLALVGGVDENTDPFDGVRYTSGVTAVTMAGASVSFDDFVDLINAVNGGYGAGGSIVLARNGLKKLQKIKDTSGNYIWSPPTASTPGMLWNTPYYITGQIASTFGDGSDEELAIFGNFKKNMVISPREGMRLDPSNSAVVGSDNAYTQNLTMMRFLQALSIDVVRPAGFAYLQFK